MSREILLRKLIENGLEMSAVVWTPARWQGGRGEQGMAMHHSEEMWGGEVQVRGQFYLIIASLLRKKWRQLLRE